MLLFEPLTRYDDFLYLGKPQILKSVSSRTSSTNVCEDTTPEGKK
jgi:hypothetical protein